MGNLESKVIVVTGGASGIGRATCARLAAAGATAVVADVNLEAAEAVVESLPSASAVQFDAEDPASIKALMDTTVKRHGRIDGLHNNAALIGASASGSDSGVVDTDLDMFDRIMAVNVRGFLAGCRYAIPHMERTGGGSIVNTSSVAGLVSDTHGVGYGISKAAIIGLTRFVATTCGPKGIRCNAIAPGLTITPAVKDFASALIELQLPHVPLGRHANPADIANLVAFLMSDDSSFITGQVHVCDGGLLAHLPTYADLLRSAAGT